MQKFIEHELSFPFWQENKWIEWIKDCLSTVKRERTITTIFEFPLVANLKP